MCGGAFEATKTVEDAQAEYERLYPEEAARSEPVAVVCAFCFGRVRRGEEIIRRIRAGEYPIKIPPPLDEGY